MTRCKSKTDPEAFDPREIEAAFNEGFLPQIPVVSQEFVDLVESPFGPDLLIHDDLQRMERNYACADPKGAILDALTAIGRLLRQNIVLLTAMRSAKRRISHAIAVTEKGSAAARRKRSEQAQERYGDIAAQVESLMAANCQNSLTYARQQVADSRKIAINTVKAATAGMKGPPKKKKK